MAPQSKLKYIEVEAKTIKEAINTALKTLNLTKKDVAIKVLREEQSGLFGMEGPELAKVRITIQKTLDSNKNIL